jgi:hypothetical protein
LNFSEKPEEDEEKGTVEKTPSEGEIDGKEITNEHLEGISALCSAKASMKGHSAMRALKSHKGASEEDQNEKKPLAIATAPVSVHTSEILQPEYLSNNNNLENQQNL